MSRIRRTISSLLVFMFFVVFLELFSAQTVHAQFICTTDCPVRAQSIRQELQDLRAAGINTYIYWQYSGSCSNPWADSNDPYSFFQGDSICEVFKEAADAGMQIGVNTHHLSTHLGETDQLAYLHNDCGVSIIRFFAYPNIGSGAATARATVDAINAAGMSAIPVICDYSNTCTELGITNQTQTDPTSWYESGYQGAYREYALQLRGALMGSGMFGIELLNEPHCGGRESCVQPYANWATDMVNILSGLTVGIGQKASENTTRGDSPGVGSPSDFIVSNVATAIASAHFYNASEKSLALSAASQAGGKPFYIGERGMRCDGSEVPKREVEEVPCDSGRKSLTVRGNIKSSYDFAVTKDPETGDNVFIKRDDIPQADWINYTFINNQPVAGAIVAVYPSVAFSGGDIFGNSHTNSPGKVGGKLDGRNGLISRKTGWDGSFELSASTDGNGGEVCQYGGWKQYLAVMCVENRGGVPTPVVRDLYAFPITEDGKEVDLGDINIACDADLTKYGSISAPQSLDYVLRDPEKFLACGDYGGVPVDRTIDKDIYWDQNLVFKDYYSETWGWPFVGLSQIIQVIKDIIRDRVPFKGPKEGFMGAQQVSSDIRSMFASTAGLYGGIKSNTVELARYFYNLEDKPENAQTYDNGKEEKPPLPLCEELRRCSESVNFDGETNNAQTCGGLANNLRAPFDAITTDSSGSFVFNELGYAARYLLTDKTIEICKDTNTADAVRHVLSEVAPPTGLCGDVDRDGNVGAGEMPCPDNPNCGDLNNNGRIDGTETACQAGEFYYNFDSRYFPYDVLYTGTTEPQSYRFQTREKTGNDSVSSPSIGNHHRTVPFSNNENTRPDNVTSSQRFPEGFQETKLPAGIYNSYDKIVELAGSATSAQQNPASLTLASPADFSDSPSINTIRAAIQQLSSSIIFNAPTTFYKIGNLESLCTCSLIEEAGEYGSAGTETRGRILEDCIGTHKNEAVITYPLGFFNETSDSTDLGEIARQTTDRDITNINTIHTLQPGYKWAGDGRDNFEPLGSDGWGVNNGTLSYYDQNLASDFFTFIGNIKLSELLDCNSERRDEYEAGGGGGIPALIASFLDAECSRTVPVVSKNLTKCPWCPDMSDLKNAMISSLALKAPFSDSVNFVSTMEVDAAVTKAQDPANKEGAGQELTFNTTADSSITQMINSVSSPSFPKNLPIPSPSPAPTCTGSNNECSAFYTAVWDESSTVGTGPSAFYAGQTLTHLTGRMKFRDPIALNNGVTMMHNACKAGNSEYGSITGGLTLYVRYNGSEHEFDFDRIAACGDIMVGDVILDLYVPVGAKIAVSTPVGGWFAGWGFDGEGSSCANNFPREYYDTNPLGDTCIKGYAWSMVTRTGEAGNWDEYDTCGFHQTCGWDYNQQIYITRNGEVVGQNPYAGGCNPSDGLEHVTDHCSGLCFANRYNFSLGGVPCGQENPAF